MKRMYIHRFLIASLLLIFHYPVVCSADELGTSSHSDEIASALDDSQKAYNSQNWDAVINILDPIYTQLTTGGKGGGSDDPDADVAKWDELKDRLSEAYVKVGEQKFGQGNLEAALQDFQRAVEVDEENWIGWNDIGSIHYVKGDNETAQRNLQRAVSLNPDGTAPYIQLSHIYVEQEQYGKAIEMSSKAIKLDPSNATAFNTRGVARKNLGDIEGAIGDYRTAISLRPEFKTAKDNLKNLVN